MKTRRNVLDCTDEPAPALTLLTDRGEFTPAGSWALLSSAQSRATSASAPAKANDAGGRDTAAKRDLKAEVESSSAVQAMLEVFPAEIRDVEEM